jgi:hypothetical protein
MIIEGVMTTKAASGEVNIAPMGPTMDGDMRQLILRPFKSSTTYQNLKATGQGVFHITDDVLLIARAAIGATLGDEAAVRPADVVDGVVLARACRYHEFRVTDLDDSTDRTRIVAEVVHTGRLRDFVGFNRARHAVLEAAILATRLHLTGTTPVMAELDRLQVLIDKTGDDREQQAMAELRWFVTEYEAKG